jgi:23S rRNA pseudouridine2604 synthase
MRINKYISESGICSRRQADRHIEQGNVLLNGKKAGLADKVKKGDVVMVNGLIIEPIEKEEQIYIALNKPVGVTSTTEAGVRDNIVNFVNHSSRIFPVGRLDKDSQGLIFLTSNGDIVNKILRAANNHEKEYLVTVNKPITDDFIEKMGNGVPILGEVTKKCKVAKESAFVFRIILVQGLNRQIRRMCEHFKYEVTKLERIRIMNVNLSGIPLGEWRELTKVELDGIMKLVAQSSSEARHNPKSNKHTPKDPKRTTTNTIKKEDKSKPKKTVSNQPGKSFMKKRDEAPRKKTHAEKTKSGRKKFNRSGK